jgi:hypothetical protein
MLGVKQMAGAAAALAILAYGAAGSKAALAANGAVLTAAATPAQAAAVRAYWTKERLASAQPLDLVTAKTFEPGSPVARAAGPTSVVPGAPPSAAYDPSLAEQLYVLQGRNGVGPTAVGSIGQRYPYTIGRLYPCGGSGCPTSSNSYSNVWLFYPYETVGHLYFTIGTSPFVCSASVIRRSVIATAGHCTSDGKGHFYNNWLFVPAEHGGFAPFGKWTWTRVVVTGPWFNGGGIVPNRQDDALIVLAASLNGQRIGNVTGNLGYEFNPPLPTHISQLGYPCNLDQAFGCTAGPIRDDSQDYSGPNNNFEWGTAAFGGASGGPEIQDFGQQPLHPSGTPPVETLGGNILISSNSYTYASNVQVDGGSILAAPHQFGGTLNTFGDLINLVCATPGNC